MSNENKTKKRDIVAASEANVNHLSNILDTNDFKSLMDFFCTFRQGA